MFLLPFLALLLLCEALPRPIHAQTASQFYAQGVEAYNKGDAAAAKHQLQLALEIDRNFRPATALLTKMATEQRPATGGPVPGMSAKALESTVVPVEFNNTTLTTAIEFIRQKAAEVSGGRVVINFAVNLPPELANRKVTLKMDHVPVSEMLRYLGEMTGVSFDRQPYAIVVTSAKGKAAEAVHPAATPAS